MNLVASAVLRGMVGASSSADMGVEKGKSKSRSDASASDRAADTLKSSNHSQDAREALKGAQTESGVSYNAQHQQTLLKWWKPRAQADSDMVDLSDAAKSAPDGSGAAYAQPANQDAPKYATIGGKLSIKI